MKSIFLKSILMCCILLLNACTKNVAGPKGENGTPGKNGNTNQSATNSFVQKRAAWDSVDVITEIQWQSTIYVTEISPTVLKNGEVKVYAFVDNNWWPLPFYEGQLVTQYGITNGQVKLFHTNVHGQTPDRPGDRSYRIVVISPKQ